MATLLTCRAISKHFGTRELFDGLSISFADEERVGFLGPNGAGKTTFLEIIAGLEQADCGEIDRRRSARICFVPQDDRFANGATVDTVLTDAIADEPLEQHEREDLQAHEISELYTETISTLSPRIVVNGNPQYLRNERTVDWVRTLLLAGLRSAILWNQLGGSRFELMFGRKKIIKEGKALLMS